MSPETLCTKEYDTHREVCRLCLTRDMPMHKIADTPLQDIYDKLSDVPLNTAHWPVGTCYICYSQLRKCHSLMVRCVRANKVLKQTLQNGDIVNEESDALLNQETNQLKNTFSITPIRLLSITGSDISLVSLIEINVDKSPTSPSRGTEEIEMETLISVEHLKVEMDEVMETADSDHHPSSKSRLQPTPSLWSPGSADSQTADNDMQDNESQRLPSIEECVESEEAESEKSNKAEEQQEEGAGPTEECDVTPDENNKPAILRANIIAEIPSSSIAYTLRSTRKTLNLTELPENTSICSNVINKDRINTDNTDTGVKNSIVKHKKHTQSGKNQYECLICERRFIDKHGLNRHFRIHTGERRFKCHICKVGFKQKAHLGNHLRTHSGEKPFECGVCKVKFSQKAHLESHSLTHSEMRPFKCEVCKQRFKRKDHMKLHFRIHTGEKPYECHICKLRFTLKPTLTSHLRTHTGEKPFECDVCPRRFAQRSDVKKHMRTHTGEKPFECVICRRLFTIKGNMTKHLKTHTKERPFKCVVCQHRFKRKDHLEYHMRTHVGDEPTECEEI